MAKTSLRGYVREIETLLDRGQVEEVVAHCLHVLKSHPKYLEVYRLLGKAYLEMKKYGDAVDIFSRVIVCSPSDFVAHVGMSIIRDEEGKIDDAIWHMERAFESQPSNAAVQSELQRLYARRDGSAPPRIRMTRGALAQMYVKGELYPQAISEIKSVLQEDPGRTDMTALLARAYARGGQKNEAAEVASSLLRRYPYCYDANAVLVDLLGAEKPESVEVHRARVIELDPYTAHVNGSVLSSAEAPDSAISIERLDWTGQAVSMPADWRETSGISLESRDEQPDWLRSAFSTETEVPPQPAGMVGSQPADSIPDFLREAGWGESTGAFDESKASMGGDEETIPPNVAAPLSEGELPDWVREMAPPEAMKPAEESEAMPDWLDKIDPGILAPSKEPSAVSDAGQFDWMKDTGEPKEPVQLTSDFKDEMDWINDLGKTEEPAQQAVTSSEQPDWLTKIGSEPQSSATTQPPMDFDFLNQPPSAAAEPAAPDSVPPMAASGLSPQAEDDAFAWLEGLAAKQGATEGLLTKPEERAEQEPDWVKQARSSAGEPQMPAIPSAAEPVQEPPVATPPASLEGLGKTEREQDDSFAWLENLAAKQGASEGLLTKPEDRASDEPAWVRQAKEMGEIIPPVPPIARETESSVDTSMWLRSLDEEESKVEPPRQTGADETAMWLKSLDAAEPKKKSVDEFSDVDSRDWLRKLDEESAPPVEASAEKLDLPSWMQDVDSAKMEMAEEPAANKVEPEEVVSSADEEESPLLSGGPLFDSSMKVETGGLPSWLRGIDEDAPASAVPDELPSWLRDDNGEVVAEPTKIEPTRPADWHPIVTGEAEELEVPKPKPAPKKAVHKKTEPQPAVVSESVREPAARKLTGMLAAEADPMLEEGRGELSRSNIPGALEAYSRLIKRGRFLEEVIFDLRDALYRYPVEVSIWQSLGDAYMRANRLQDALDAYTKAEELLR